jgi:hypothetical protein
MRPSIMGGLTMSSTTSTQLQSKEDWYTPGRLAHVSFTSLELLQKYEPEIYALFKNYDDGARVKTQRYDYLLHINRFGKRITRFDNGKQQQQTQQQQIVNPTKDSKTIFQQVKERRESARKESTRQEDTQELLHLLEILQDVRRSIDNLVLSTQNQLRARSLI